MSGNTSKTMSSRLMTMKFMQRSAAKKVTSSPATPNGPPSKRARLSNGGSVHGTPDHEILQTALAEEEKKRQEASDKAAQYTGETKWVLSFQDPLKNKRQDTMTVRQAGFAELDADHGSEDEEEAEEVEDIRPIRMRFGGGVKKKADAFVPFVSADDSEGETDSSSEELDSDDPTAALIRETKRDMAAERRQARTSMDNSTPKRTLKPIDEDTDMSRMTSLSGGGGKPAGRDTRNMECFHCGQRGHARANCPKQSQSRGSSGRGRGRGRP
ncbi:hypothetical protein ACN47E_008154 [Coniothyrium glycines]